jgi:hypothetical protein
MIEEKTRRPIVIGIILLFVGTNMAGEMRENMNRNTFFSNKIEAVNCIKSKETKKKEANKK